MDFNLGKCEFNLVRIKNKKHLLKNCYYLQGEQIKSIPIAKYLGVVIDEHLSFNDPVKMFANKALQVYPYFWQTYMDLASYLAKSSDKLVNHSCQLAYSYVAS